MHVCVCVCNAHSIYFCLNFEMKIKNIDSNMTSGAVALISTSQLFQMVKIKWIFSVWSLESSKLHANQPAYHLCFNE